MFLSVFFDKTVCYSYQFVFNTIERGKSRFDVLLKKILLSLGCPSCHSLMMALGFFVLLYLRLVRELFIECNQYTFVKTKAQEISFFPTHNQGVAGSSPAGTT